MATAWRILNVEADLWDVTQTLPSVIVVFAVDSCSVASIQPTDPAGGSSAHRGPFAHTDHKQRDLVLGELMKDRIQYFGAARERNKCQAVVW
ncbi:hypothetical protein TSMEX_011547 [Taenia solium]